ncbi:MAG: adenine deaminase [Parachlamydia sp.]|nr:adenine deaminase [Parachlamydia sp.]
MNNFSIEGIIVDLFNRRIYPGKIHLAEGKIASIEETDIKREGPFILPGWIDSHVHIESSMLVPSEFARLATPHGTIGTVSDPHEIANVMGIEGIRYMIENGAQVPFHFYFGASSCVPATSFETPGATINAEEIELLFREYHLRYLSEMMNFPGVLNGDPLVLDKIEVAQRFNCPVDGHAPGLRGKEAAAYIAAGISTDHECFTLDEALDKLQEGMKIIIREGSAARNFDALHTLIKSHPAHVMFCSDDKHPHELAKGHINEMVKRSINEHGYDLFDVLRVASVNPVEHYRLDCGLLRPGDSADFILVDHLTSFNVLETYVKGQLVAKEGKTFIESVPISPINHFHCSLKNPDDFRIPAGKGNLQVIQVIDGQLVTNKIIMAATTKEGFIVSDPQRDLLKIAVINRYHEQPIAIGFINQFGLKKGAIASCIAHDSHNIIGVGADDVSLSAAVNAIIEQKGGISAAFDGKVEILPLPIGGIMSNRDGFQVSQDYLKMDQLAKDLGSHLGAPFMTLSFMALLVIPSLKLSDKGLFDGTTFTFTPLMTE